MTYNKDKRRGIYSKPTKRHKPRQPAKKVRQEQTIIENHALYPYLKRFIEWGAIKGHADATLITRQRGLNRFLLWCEERDLEQPRDITREHLESYQKHLHYYRKRDGDPLSYGTQHGLLSPIRLFFKWLAKTHQILYNPASELELPRQQRGLPKTLLSVDEVKTILNVADITSPFGVRDRAILETFYNTGIRRMECVHLQLYDVDMSRRTLHVRKGKGNKDRIVPIGEVALQWIQQYLDEVRPILIKEHAERCLFLTDYGEPWIKNRLTDMVKKYIYHAGIDKPGACHLFRHAMATHMLDNGADIRYIQAMLGHSLLSTTQIYTQVSVESLRKVHNATHPLNRPKT